MNLIIEVGGITRHSVDYGNSPAEHRHCCCCSNSLKDGSSSNFKIALIIWKLSGPSFIILSDISKCFSPANRSLSSLLKVLRQNSTIIEIFSSLYKDYLVWKIIKKNNAKFFQFFFFLILFFNAFSIKPIERSFMFRYHHFMACARHFTFVFSFSQTEHFNSDNKQSEQQLPQQSNVGNYNNKNRIIRIILTQRRIKGRHQT